MENEIHITRRKALKKMGAVAIGAALSASGLSAAESLNITERRKMKVVAINDSSHKDGNTADMLNVVLQELEKQSIEIEHIQLAGQTIHPCTACFACAGEKELRVQ